MSKRRRTQGAWVRRPDRIVNHGGGAVGLPPKGKACFRPGTSGISSTSFHGHCHRKHIVPKIDLTWPDHEDQPL